MELTNFDKPCKSFVLYRNILKCLNKNMYKIKLCTVHTYKNSSKYKHQIIIHNINVEYSNFDKTHTHTTQFIYVQHAIYRDYKHTCIYQLCTLYSTKSLMIVQSN